MREISKTMEKTIIQHFLNKSIDELYDMLIDRGSSRMVFEADEIVTKLLELGDDNYVIKIGLTDAGARQNANEVDAFTQYGKLGYLAQIYAYSKSIVIMERVDTWDLRDIASDLVDFFEEGDYDYYYEDFENFGLETETEAYNAAETVDFLNTYIVHSSDNGQIGKNKDGKFVAYDYGFTGDCMTECSDLEDEDTEVALQYIWDFINAQA